MEGEGSYNPNKKRAIEFHGEFFEVDEPDVLNPEDIHDNDRVFVRTESGNRYMIRHSKSRGGVLTIYNEREKFQNGHPLHLQGQIAEIGKPLSFIMITDSEKKTGTPVYATKVMGVEIRRGMDKAIEETSREISGGDLARMLQAQFHPKEKVE